MTQEASSDNYLIFRFNRGVVGDWSDLGNLSGVFSSLPAEMNLKQDTAISVNYNQVSYCERACSRVLPRRCGVRTDRLTDQVPIHAPPRHCREVGSDDSSITMTNLCT